MVTRGKNGNKLEIDREQSDGKVETEGYVRGKKESMRVNKKW